ncbi:MAG: Gfo/Idh/MocA family oxidoreductase [bacterium]
MTKNIGIIGCGNIFSAYIKGCAMFRAVKVVACADINMDVAKAKATEFKLKAMTVDKLLADPSIDFVINLTVPKVHAEVSLKALRAGKHVYSEKPLALDVGEGRKVLDYAKKRGLRMGCAPDTFLGAGLQTCRKLIDDGWIGRPLSGTAFMMSQGPESWHPNPAFFYQRGAGPMLDMGPYYITALVHLLGPIKAVSAMTGKGLEQRLATCKEHFGEMIPVEIPTHNSGSLLFESGAIVTLVVSFDVQRHHHSPIEIYGTEGSLAVPDPNTFGGPVSVFRPGNEAWREMPFAYGYHDNSRGIGVADMAYAIQSGRPHRCDVSLALHALEVMLAFEESGQTRSWVDIKNPCAQPKPFPQGLPPGVLDD